MDDQLKAYLQKKMESHFHLLPEHNRGAIERYLFNKLEPGGFLFAVLANDLKGAIGRADSENLRAIADITQFCMWALPSNCWGSEERVNAWLKGDEVSDE